MGAQFESAKELREVIDAVFSMMDADPDMGPKLRDANTPQRFEFSDFDVVVNIRGARAPADQDRRRPEGGTRADPDDQADLRAVPRLPRALRQGSPARLRCGIG